MNAMERLNMKMKVMNSRIVAGLDPTVENLPPELRPEDKDNIEAKVSAIRQFCYQYVDAIHKLVPAIKINSAFFEEEELQPVYREIARYAQKRGMFVIGDLKRADIGSTSAAYANAWLGKNQPFDAITVNPYFGTDGIQPFIDVAVENNKGIFVLVKTSNKSSEEIQNKTTFMTRQNVFEHVAELVDCWGRSYTTSKEEYSLVGAVVGATHPKEAAMLRTSMPNTMFLVPGYGAQGAGADDVAINFDAHGGGAIVNSSRGLMCAYKKEEYELIVKTEGWRDATIQATKDAVDDINRAINR